MGKKDIKICILMLGLFGDVLLRTPILRSIKEKYSNSNITVVADKVGYDILYNNPIIDNIIVINRDKKNILKYIYFKLITQFKIVFSRFDLIIDLYNGSSSRNMVRLSFSKHRVIPENQYKKYCFSNNYHLTNQLFNSLSALELNREAMNLEPEFFINKQVENIVLNSLPYIRDKNKYLLSLGSRDIKKIIDIEKTYKIVEYLYKNYQLIPIIILNPGQEFLQSELINTFIIPNNIEYIKLEKATIDEIAIIMKYSKFFIVPDTGLMHLALSLKIPIFCIFTHTNPMLVEPEDTKLYTSCYKIKEPKEYDVFGLENCTREISFMEIKNYLEIFIKKINLKV